VGFVDDVQSLLINGRGKYNCSSIANVLSTSPDCLTCNATSPNCAPFVLPVIHGNTYRLRIANVASLSSLNFILEVCK
jgi:L-ascorbate oxidase